MRLVLILVLISGSLVSAQGKVFRQKPVPTDKPVEVVLPDLAALLRENEGLKREKVRLLEDIRARDTALMLAVREKDSILKDLATDRDEPTAKQSRCAVLEGQLRKLENRPEIEKFDCDTMTFK